MEGTEVEQRKVIAMARKLLLFPFPLQGHLTPMLHLANLLHSQGFSITFIQTRFNSLNPTRYPHFSFHFLDDRLPEGTVLTVENQAEIVPTIEANCREPFCVYLSQILTALAVDQDPFLCLISDQMWSFAGSVAQTFNLPRIALRTGGTAAWAVYESLPALRDKGYFSLQEAKFDEIVPGLHPVKVRDLPIETYHSILATFVKETKTAQGVICNTFEELEGSSLSRVSSILPVPIFPIGPIHKHAQPSAASIWAQERTSISWLDTQAPKTVLYVSFGSIVATSESDFMEVAWGLANSKQPFLWVIRPGLVEGLEFDDLLPEGYMDLVGGRGHIVRWAPQLEVLSHPAVAAFWTHCGWNSIMESISEGVPMLCLPFFADQAINARYISDSWKVGLQLEKGIKREDIERTIRKLMAEDEGAELRNRVAELKEKAKLCITGGSSYESLERLTGFLLSL